ncbi:MAG: nuclear transport factor 2 family protein [Promethearchaeota archaeon]
MKTDNDNIKGILQILQEGYTKRDPKYIDTFMQIYSSKDSSLIIGTGQGGDFRGFEKAKELFLWDWKYWGDVTFDIETTDIQVNGNMAWVFIFAGLNLKHSEKYLNELALNRIKSTLENEKTSENAKIADILRLSSLNFVEKVKGEEFICPLRVTVVLTKEKENWFINHMHFSNPIGLFNSFPRKEEI